MLLDWFNAREAVQVGAALADYFLPQGTPAPGGRVRDRPVRAANDIQAFSNLVAREVRSLKLNFFKRARLLNAFKWRLREHGIEHSAADQYTELLLMQLSGIAAGVPARGSNTARASSPAQPARRLPALLAEADARFAAGKYADAADKLTDALAIDPNNALARNGLGTALWRLGRYREAEPEFRRAVKLKPGFAEAHRNLGTILRHLGDLPQSESALRRAVKLSPGDVDSLVSLGLTLGWLGRLADARELFDKALRIKPRSASALSALGWLEGIEGRLEEAESRLRAALESEPQNAAAWAALGNLRRMTAADGDWLKGVERTLSSGVSSSEEADLRFAMGKYFDDLGSFARAFTEYKRANDLHKLLAKPYDRKARTAFVDNVIRAYTRERLSQHTPGASESERPVLVVGMMRSGTTLVEQIIASHPRATAAGELDYWNDTVRKHPQIVGHESPNAPHARRLADSYLAVLTRHSADALRVVDKSTVNSDHLGLIHSVLPRARIVYLRRDPIDTCLSCYFQQFASALSFTMDLGDLAHYYREHYRLVAHWRAALPAGTLLDVPYAELVADPQAWTRRIIDFIGLEWDPRCLEFYKTKRAVLTASTWQVRQPIYTRSVARWRNYQKWLGPLLELRDLSD
jgi:Flp pilus assembly protein TadD